MWTYWLLLFKSTYRRIISNVFNIIEIDNEQGMHYGLDIDRIEICLTTVSYVRYNDLPIIGLKMEDDD